MLKGYIGAIKPRELPSDITDYSFTDDPASAAYWDSKEQAEIDCMIWNRNGIKIPSAQGGDYICKDFKSEEYRPGRFVVFCEAPFLAQPEKGTA